MEEWQSLALVVAELLQCVPFVYDKPQLVVYTTKVDIQVTETAAAVYMAEDVLVNDGALVGCRNAATKCYD